MPRPTNNNEESMTRSVNGTVFDYNINASMVPGTTVGAIEFMVRASANGWRPITVDPGPLKAPAYWRSDRQLWEPSVPGEIPTGQWRMMAGWKQEPAVTPMKAAALAAWPPFSVGLVMGLQPLELGPRTFVVALDIDVDDPAAAAEVDAALVGVLGNSPVRFGRRPRRTRLYRVVEETPNWTSARFRLPTDPPEHKGQHVQLLGAGKQTIAFGIHPATGKPFEWVGVDPTQVSPWRLPFVTPKQLEAARQACEAALERRGGVLVARASAGRAGQDNDPRGPTLACFGRW